MTMTDTIDTTAATPGTTAVPKKPARAHTPRKPTTSTGGKRSEPASDAPASASAAPKPASPTPASRSAGSDIAAAVKPAAPQPATTPPVTTKTAIVLALLARPEGASLAEMIAATGWQQHSVRGFLAGTVRKKPELELVSQKTGETRTWRTVPAGTAQ